MNRLDDRTKLAVKNISASFVLRGASMFITFLLIPITLGYLNSYEYGIWVTLNSILSWVYFLDIGLGNGLKNKLAEAIAMGDYERGRVYVSTTMFLMILIILCFYTLFLCANLFLDWYGILSVNEAKVDNLNSLVIMVFAFVSLNFVTKIVGNIYQAYQKTAVNDLLLFLGNALSLLIIVVLTKTTSGSLTSVALTYSVVPVIISLVALPITFKKYHQISPSLKFVRLNQVKNLALLGVNFFIIQIACVVLFMTSNVIISNLFGPEEVTPYNIASKYYSVISFGYNIILSPFWVATTDAFSKGDFLWIKRTILKIFYIWVASSALVVVMYLLSPFVYDLWIGESVVIQREMTLWSGIYVVILTLSNTFAIFINGFGKLRIQLIFSALQTIFYIPLAIYCGKLFGVYGILIAMCITCFMSLLWSPRQCWLLLNNKAYGWWNK